MKILRIHQHLPENALYSEYYIAKYLNQHYIQTTFLTANNKIKTKYYESFKIKIIKSINIKNHYIPFDKNIFNLKLKDYKFIHISGISNIFSIILYSLIIFQKPKKSKIIFSDHSNPNYSKYNFIIKVYYTFLHLLLFLTRDNIQAIITVNNDNYDLISARYSKLKSIIHVIPLGYDSEYFFFNPLLKNNSPQFIIGFAGKIEPRKNIELLITGIGLSKYKSNIILEIVGGNKNNDYLKNLHVIAKENKINIIFHEFINNPTDLNIFYNYIDLAIYPGSISITTLEASGAGTPVILYNSIKGLDDRVSDGRGSLFNTIDELARLIDDYFEKKINNNLISNNSLKYSWNNIIKRYLKILDYYE